MARMKISGYDFEGPHSIDTTEIPANRAAVYVIMCKASSDGKYYVEDVGETGEVGVRIADHERRLCWKRKCIGSLSVYLRYMRSAAGYTSEDRRKLERKIREQYHPPCGKR